MRSSREILPKIFDKSLITVSQVWAACMTSALWAVPWRTTSCRCGGSTSSRRSRSWRSTAPCWPPSPSSSRCQHTQENMPAVFFANTPGLRKLDLHEICPKKLLALFSGRRGMWINSLTTWWKMPRQGNATALITSSKVTLSYHHLEDWSGSSPKLFIIFLLR